MKVKILVDGYPVECESPLDAAILLKSLSGKNGHGSKSGAQSSILDVATYSDFVSRLHKSQKKLLKALLAEEGTVEDKNLLKAMSMNDNREIGGVLAGISRNAGKVGFGMDAVLSSETRHSEEGRSKLYTLTAEFRRLAKEVGFK